MSQPATARSNHAWNFAGCSTRNASVAFAAEAEFQCAAKGEAGVSTDSLSTLARCVSYLEEALGAVRDAPGPDRAKLEILLERLANLGIEEEMSAKPPKAPPRKRKSH